MERIKSFFQRDRFAALAGIELLEVSPGYAKVKMPIDDRHLNGVCCVHGGAIFTLADFAFAVASNSHGTVAVAAQVSITFVKAARQGAALYAEAREASRGSKLASYTIHVTDQDGGLIAIFQGLAYRMDQTLDAVAADV